MTQQAEKAKRFSTCANSLLGGPVMPAQTRGMAPRLASVEEYRARGRAAMADVRWPNASTLTVGFLNGSQALRDAVEALAPQWSQWANIKFRFVNGPSDDITINFIPMQGADYGTYSSQLGTDSAGCARAGQPSMHLVFNENDDNNNDAEYQRVILHEFGHALGLIHEHARPDRPILWDNEAVYRQFQEQTGGKWDWNMIYQQVIAPYSGHLTHVTDFDPTSIMMYPFPEGLAYYKDGTPFSTDWNRALSDGDKSLIKAVYQR